MVGIATTTLNTPRFLQQQVQQLTVASLASSANPSLLSRRSSSPATITNGGTQHATGLVALRMAPPTLGSSPLDPNGVATLNLPHSLPANNRLLRPTMGMSQTSRVPLHLRTISPATRHHRRADRNSHLSYGWTAAHVDLRRPLDRTCHRQRDQWSSRLAIRSLRPLLSTRSGGPPRTIILDPGAATIVASYSGDSVYSASQSPATPISDGPPTSFTIQASFNFYISSSKQHTTINLTLTSISGFSTR